MDLVKQIFNEKKLLVRAMDLPQLKRNSQNLEYDCTTWANEFYLLSYKKLSSASTTLIIPNISIPTYKSIGFLINSDLANCFHVSISDSGSKGNLENGDFWANNSSINNIEELSNYIEDNNSTIMNEVNIVSTIDSVVGLFINKCERQEYLLSFAIIIKKMLQHMLDIEYPIYLYDAKYGSIEKINLTTEIQNNIISHLKTKNIFYWPDEYNEPAFANIDNLKSKTL